MKLFSYEKLGALAEQLVDIIAKKRQDKQVIRLYYILQWHNSSSIVRFKTLMARNLGMGAQNINFASKFSKIGISSLKYCFFERESYNEKKIFQQVQIWEGLHPSCDAIGYRCRNCSTKISQNPRTFLAAVQTTDETLIAPR